MGLSIVKAFFRLLMVTSQVTGSPGPLLLIIQSQEKKEKEKRKKQRNVLLDDLFWEY